MTKTCLESGDPCQCAQDIALNKPDGYSYCCGRWAKYEVASTSVKDDYTEAHAIAEVYAMAGAEPPAPSKPPEQGVNATLAERGARYGSFVDHAAIAEALISTAMSYPGWRKLAPDQRQSFRMFADKQARILSGDPNYSDSWHDIAGYATLIDNRLKAEGK